MTWIPTFTGRKFSLVDPQPEDVCLTDIVESLSKICRFTGHITEEYSVAQHSVLVSQNVPEEFAYDALMHDAAEAYYGDIHSGLKRFLEDRLGISWESIVSDIDRVVSDTLGFRWPSPPRVKEADEILCATEIRDLFSYALDPQRPLPRPLRVRIIPIAPVSAAASFRRHFRMYTGRVCE